MSSDNYTIVPVGQRGIVASVSRQISMTEKLLGVNSKKMNHNSGIVVIDSFLTELVKSNGYSIHEKTLHERIYHHLELRNASSRIALKINDSMHKVNIAQVDSFCDFLNSSNGGAFTEGWIISIPRYSDSIINAIECSNLVALDRLTLWRYAYNDFYGPAIQRVYPSSIVELIIDNTTSGTPFVVYAKDSHRKFNIEEWVRKIAGKTSTIDEFSRICRMLHYPNTIHGGYSDNLKVFLPFRQPLSSTPIKSIRVFNGTNGLHVVTNFNNIFQQRSQV